MPSTTPCRLGAIPGRLGNPDIGWESTEQTNVGIDVELFSSKLSFTGDVYNKQTTGILIAVPVSTLIGYTATDAERRLRAATPAGRPRVNWRSNVRTFNYSIGFNISDNKNRVTSLPGGDQINPANIRLRRSAASDIRSTRSSASRRSASSRRPRRSRAGRSRTRRPHRAI